MNTVFLLRWSILVLILVSIPMLFGETGLTIALVVGSIGVILIARLLERHALVHRLPPPPVPDDPSPAPDAAVPGTAAQTTPLWAAESPPRGPSPVESPWSEPFTNAPIPAPPVSISEWVSTIPIIDTVKASNPNDRGMEDRSTSEDSGASSAPTATLTVDDAPIVPDEEALDTVPIERAAPNDWGMEDRITSADSGVSLVPTATLTVDDAPIVPDEEALDIVPIAMAPPNDWGVEDWDPSADSGASIPPTATLTVDDAPIVPDEEALDTVPIERAAPNDRRTPSAASPSFPSDDDAAVPDSLEYPADGQPTVYDQTTEIDAAPLSLLGKPRIPARRSADDRTYTQVCARLAWLLNDGITWLGQIVGIVSPLTVRHHALHVNVWVDGAAMDRVQERVREWPWVVYQQWTRIGDHNPFVRATLHLFLETENPDPVSPTLRERWMPAIMSASHALLIPVDPTLTYTITGRNEQVIKTWTARISHVWGRTVQIRDEASPPTDESTFWFDRQSYLTPPAGHHGYHMRIESNDHVVWFYADRLQWVLRDASIEAENR